MIKVLALMGVILAPSFGAAASFYVKDSPHGSYIEMIGGTSVGDLNKLKTKIKEAKAQGDFTDTLVLRGPGGRADEAKALNEWMVTQNLTTVVESGKTCASACAIMWLSGKERVAKGTAKIGIHYAYLPTAGMNLVKDETGWQGVRERLAKLAVWQTRMYEKMNLKDHDRFYEIIDYTTGLHNLTPEEITDVIGAQYVKPKGD